MAEKIPWQVEFYTDDSGKSPVREFISKLAVNERAKVFRGLLLLQEFGTAIGKPHVAPVVGKLWELREGPARIFYFVYINRRLVVLHGYYKKSQKAPQREINTALRRMADYLERDK